MKDEKMSVKNKNDDWLEEINQRLDCLRDDQANFNDEQTNMLIRMGSTLYEIQKKQMTIWRLIDKLTRK